MYDQVIKGDDSGLHPSSMHFIEHPQSFSHLSCFFTTRDQGNFVPVSVTGSRQHEIFHVDERYSDLKIVDSVSYDVVCSAMDKRERSEGRDRHHSAIGGGDLFECEGGPRQRLVWQRCDGGQPQRAGMGDEGSQLWRRWSAR